MNEIVVHTQEVQGNLEEELIKTLVEVADNLSEEDELAINRIGEIIKRIIED